jgi:hypothetical protein
MKYEIEKENIENIFQALNNLDRLLTERISDLHDVKGMMQARHAYIFYRHQVNNVGTLIKESLKNVKDKSK